MSRPQQSLTKRSLPPVIPFQGSRAFSRQFRGGVKKGGDNFDNNACTADMVKLYLNENQDFLERYLLENVNGKRLLRIANSKLTLEREDTMCAIENKTMTVNTTDNRPNTSLRRALLDRGRFLSELTRDISRQPNKARILLELKDCISSAINADASSLYLVDETGEKIYFCGTDGNFSHSPCVKWIAEKETLAAFVAHSKRSECIEDINADERFEQALPIGGDLVQSVLAQPIYQDENIVVGVVEFYRYSGKSPFLIEDEEIVNTYLIWGGVAVNCSEMYHKNSKQQRLNEFILDVAQSMFGKFKSMNSVIKDIMRYAKDLVKADRASLFMVDRDTQEIYSHIFDVGSYHENEFLTKETVIRFPMHKGIAGFVASTGTNMRINDAYGDPRFNREIDQQTGYTTKTILCMPVKLQAEVIGVVQMLNNLNGQFTKEDEFHFQTFATYCGLALHIAKMYEKIRRSEQKYKVALEVLSYHSQYNPEELAQLKRLSLPTEIPQITEYTFSPWSVKEMEKPLHVMYMFKDLFDLQKFDEETLMKFTLTVRKNYRRVPYHNWAHAFSVTHSMYTIIKTTKHKLSTEECLAMFVGCLCHDLDHRGKTNNFMVKSATPLAAIYSTSTMEHHHFNMTVTILQREGHNIFKRLSSANYKKILGNVKHCILATDLVKFIDYQARLNSIMDHDTFDWDLEEHRLTLMAISMTSSDLCSMFKPWKIQLALVMVIMEEFWIQGDEEKTQGETPIRMMDRSFRHELPESQVAFIKGICLPCYTSLCRVLTEASPMVLGGQQNLSRWESMAQLDPTTKRQKMLELEASLKSADGGGALELYLA